MLKNTPYPNRLGCAQNYARKFTIPIDLLTMTFTVLPVDSAETPPTDGVYVNGMFLEGARWDRDSGTLAESLPKIVFDSLPIVWVLPAGQVP